MKVLQINAVNKISSTGRTCYEMSEFLNANGHSCITAYSKGVSVNSNNEFIIGSNIDTKVHGLLSRLTGKQGYFSFFATKKLLKFMDEYNPDVVVLRNLHGNFINLPMLLKYLAKKDIATVIVLHDCWFFTGKCCHYTLQNCYKWKDVCGICPQLKKYNKSWFFDRTSTMFRDKKRLLGQIPRLAVVGVSDWILNEAKKSPVFKTAKMFKRVYNWIDIETFSQKNSDSLRENLGLTNKKVVLSVAGGWNKEKGIDTVIEIAKNLNEDEKYILVGVVDDIDLPQSVINIPAINSPEELATYYSLADVFVQPSLQETFGKVSAEALACGTPMVCFNSTANPELVCDGCGAAVEAVDTGSMLFKIRNIFSQDKAKYSEKCLNFAKFNFNKNTNLQEYMELFEEVLGD